MSVWSAWIGALPFDWAQYTFMHHALLAILLVAPLFALLGSLVISNQMTFFSEAIGHASLTGIAIGAIAGLHDPMISMVAFACLLAVGISVLRRTSRISTDTIIGLVMAFTVALGVVLLSRGGGFAKYSRYLIGDILTVTTLELGGMALLALGIIILGGFSFNRLFLVSFNRSLARSRGVNVWLVETGFAAVVALVVTASIPWIGLLVINALLILPAATARNWARNTPQYIWLAVGLSLAAGVSGLIGSYYWTTATGATIVLVAMFFFFASLLRRRR